MPVIYLLFQCSLHLQEPQVWHYTKRIFPTHVATYSRLMLLTFPLFFPISLCASVVQAYLPFLVTPTLIGAILHFQRTMSFLTVLSFIGSYRLVRTLILGWPSQSATKSLRYFFQFTSPSLAASVQVHVLIIYIECVMKYCCFAVQSPMFSFPPNSKRASIEQRVFGQVDILAIIPYFSYFVTLVYSGVRVLFGQWMLLAFPSFWVSFFRLALI